MSEEPIKPQRLQLSRRKGFNLQAASVALNGLPAVKVDRSTEWGNPFVPRKSGGMWTGKRVVEDKRHAFTLFRSVAPLNEELVKRARAELRGKNLACWCAQDDPYEDACHAAVLLLIANSEGDASEAVLPSLVRRNTDGAVVSVRGGK